MRHATDQELEDLVIACLGNSNLADDISSVHSAFILDHYVSDGPGYVGPLAWLVFGEPCYHYTLSKRDGAWQIQHPANTEFCPECGAYLNGGFDHNQFCPLAKGY